MKVHANPFDYITVGSFGLTFGRIRDSISMASCSLLSPGSIQPREWQQDVYTCGSAYNPNWLSSSSSSDLSKVTQLIKSGVWILQGFWSKTYWINCAWGQNRYYFHWYCQLKCALSGIKSYFFFSCLISKHEEENGEESGPSLLMSYIFC